MQPPFRGCRSSPRPAPDRSRPGPHPVALILRGWRSLIGIGGLATLAFRRRGVLVILPRRSRHVIVRMDIMLHGVKQIVEILLRPGRRLDLGRGRGCRRGIEAGETPDDRRIDERPAGAGHRSHGGAGSCASVSSADQRVSAGAGACRGAGSGANATTGDGTAGSACAPSNIALSSSSRLSSSASSETAAGCPAWYAGSTAGDAANSWSCASAPSRMAASKAPVKSISTSASASAVATDATVCGAGAAATRHRHPARQDRDHQARIQAQVPIHVQARIRAPNPARRRSARRQRHRAMLHRTRPGMTSAAGSIFRGDGWLHDGRDRRGYIFLKARCESVLEIVFDRHVDGIGGLAWPNGSNGRGCIFLEARSRAPRNRLRWYRRAGLAERQQRARLHLPQGPLRKRPRNRLRSPCRWHRQAGWREPPEQAALQPPGPVRNRRTRPSVLFRGRYRNRHARRPQALLEQEPLRQAQAR